MNLLRAVRATKVLVLAFSLAMPVGLPAAAADGLPEVQTRVRHKEFKHRPPHHAFRKKHGDDRFFAGHKFAGQRRHRSVTTGIDGFSAIASGDLFDVQTRTRHVRLKDRRFHFARRDRKGRPRIIIVGGGYAPDAYGGYDLPSVIPGLGTYAGSLSAYREQGNGIYFSRAGSYRYVAENGTDAYAPAKRAKIIVVTPQTSASACSWEAGVCVVRP
jgi:hypothetical protein